MSKIAVRKIIHVDMDAFYASVEQRDNPELRGKPVVVAWKGKRSVVCAASYEARKFGVRSAMPAVTAQHLCPEGIFVPPDFTRYKAVSLQVREIFKRHTDLIEPLSLDEAYLDVTKNKTGLATATLVARTIREQIRQELSLTASAGVAPNKFLATLPPELKSLERAVLEQQFGRFGSRLYELARGIDTNEVVPDRPTKSISAEDTFEEDVPIGETEPMIRRLAEKVWAASRKETRIPRTVVLKLKTKEFKTLTRSHTPTSSPSSCEELTKIALGLRGKVGLGDKQLFRLVGVGLSNFDNLPGDIAQSGLFE